MGKIGLTGGFTPLPEGEYTFFIKSADQTKLDDYGKLTYVLVTEDGRTHREMFSFLKNNGDKNNGAYSAFSSLARAALDIPQSEEGEVDPEDLVGHYFRGSIVHNEDNSGQIRANLGWKKTHADGFENGSAAVQAQAAPAKTETKASAATKAPFDLNSLLG